VGAKASTQHGRGQKTQQKQTTKQKRTKQENAGRPVALKKFGASGFKN